jgi:hypothetical protein
LAEPQMPVNTVSIAYRGQKVDMEQYPPRTGLPKSADVQQKYGIHGRHMDYEPDVSIDFTDLQNINKEIVNLRIRLHQVRNDYKKAKRVATHLKYVYESAKKFIWIQLSGGSDKTRESMADMMCQDEYTEYLVAQTIADEMKDMSTTLRIELDALKEISNNQRRQIDIM